MFSRVGWTAETAQFSARATSTSCWAQRLVDLLMGK
jgi:hypothetical protein